MKGLKILIAGLLLLSACNDNSKSTNALPAGVDGVHMEYDTIITGLSKNYVINIDQYNKAQLLAFYKKTYIEFKTDSTDYFNAVGQFFRKDSSVIDYLISRYRGDAKKCLWIFSHHPHSSFIGNWEPGFTDEQGAAVLVYDYLMEPGIKPAQRITTSPEAVKQIIDRMSLKDIDIWYANNRKLPLEKLRNEFRRHFSRPVILHP